MAGVILSFALAIVLRVMPLPPAWFMVNPDWVALLLIYWTLIAPRSVNLIFAWFVGLAVDGLTGRLLGQYALAYVSMTYLNIRFRHTILSLPLSSQCLWVLFLLLISGIGMLCMRGSAHSHGKNTRLASSGVARLPPLSMRQGRRLKASAKAASRGSHSQLSSIMAWMIQRGQHVFAGYARRGQPLAPQAYRQRSAQHAPRMGW